MKKETQKKKWTKKTKERGERLKNNSYGITLIALVISVIVLLILAGISISMLSGNNSILQRATEAKTKTEEAQIKEQRQLDNLTDTIEEMNVGNGVYGKLYDVDGKRVLVLDNHKDFTYTNGTLQKEYDECGSSGRNWQSDAGQINKVVINGNIFPKNVTGWFANCTNLTEIEDIQKLKTSNVTDMTAMFYETKLTSMDLTCFDTSKVTNMYLMFGKCTELEYINFGDIDVSKVINIALMFSDCTKLKELDLSCFNNNQFTSLSSLESVIDYCSNLENLKLCNLEHITNLQSLMSSLGSGLNIKNLDVSNLNTENVTNMQYMFGGCSKISNIDLSHFNTKKVTNMKAMFMGCTNLTSIKVGDNWDYSGNGSDERGDDMFTNCGTNHVDK